MYPLTTADRTIDLDEFPSELRHQVTVRVIAEQWANGAVSRLERPSGNRYHTVIAPPAGQARGKESTVAVRSRRA